MTAQASDVLVVGGGVLGLCTALSLAQRGLCVRLIEARCPGAGASGYSGALIRSNCETRTEADLARRSMQVFRNWADVIGGDCGFVASGLLELADSGSAAQLRRRLASQIDWGVAVAPIDTPAANDLAPSLQLEDIRAIAYERDAGYCEPSATLQALAAAVCDIGVDLLTDERAEALQIERRRVVAVSTRRAEFSAGAVVLAAGAWVNDLLHPAGFDLGLRPRWSRLAVFHACSGPPLRVGPAVMDRAQDAWFRPTRDGGLLVGAERGGRTGVNPALPPSIETTLPEAYADVAAHRFLLPRHSPCRGLWQGVYMCAPDNLPAVGALTRVGGLYMAGGDCGAAFKLAPAIGETLAALIDGDEARGAALRDLAPDRLDLAPIHG